MMMVDGYELKHLRQLERVVLNQLGTTDPRKVAEWIVDARKCMDEWAEGVLQPHSPAHVARCAPTPPAPPEPQPQADGEPTEQDVIGLQRAYTASVDGC